MGFYINKKWGDKVVEVKGISERMAVLQLAIDKDKTLWNARVGGTFQNPKV